MGGGFLLKRKGSERVADSGSCDGRFLTSAEMALDKSFFCVFFFNYLSLSEEGMVFLPHCIHFVFNR